MDRGNQIDQGAYGFAIAQVQDVSGMQHAACFHFMCDEVLIAQACEATGETTYTRSVAELSNNDVRSCRASAMLKYIEICQK